MTEVIHKKKGDANQETEPKRRHYADHGADCECVVCRCLSRQDTKTAKRNKLKTPHPDGFTTQ